MSLLNALLKMRIEKIVEIVQTKGQSAFIESKERESRKTLENVRNMLKNR